MFPEKIMARKDGQIIRRGDHKFLIRIYQGCDPDTGKRRYLNKMVHGTKKHAQKTLTKMLRDKDMGTLQEPSRVSLDSHLDTWLETVAKHRVKPDTLDQYTRILKYLRPDLGPKQLSQLQPHEIQATLAAMMDRGLSARTVRYAHSVLRSALQQAVKWRMILTNPADAVDLPHMQKREITPMNAEQAEAFLEAARNDVLYSYFATVLTLGLRPSEGAGLVWGDIDLTVGRLGVRRTIKRRKGGGWYFDEPKTRQSRRNLPMPGSLTSILLKHQEEGYSSAHGLVFCTSSGEALDVRNVAQRNYKRILLAAGLPSSFRLYDLRHTCATLLLLAGVHPKVVSERLGHTTIRETMDTYSHVLPSMQREASEAIEGILFKESPQGLQRVVN